MAFKMCETTTFLRHSGLPLTRSSLMRKRLPVLLVLVSLLSGCGGRTFDSIKKMAPVVLLVSLAALTSRGQDRGLSRSPAR